jgi:hypothetical protein
MKDPTILFVKPKAISSKDKIACAKVGVLVVEIDNPAEAKFVRAGFELDAGAILNAAAQAIAENSSTKPAADGFGRAMCAAIEAAYARHALTKGEQQ